MRNSWEKVRSIIKYISENRNDDSEERAWWRCHTCNINAIIDTDCKRCEHLMPRTTLCCTCYCWDICK